MPPWDDARPELTGEALHLLRDLFAQRSGFVLRDDLKFVAERRLATRLELLGLRDFLSFWARCSAATPVNRPSD